MATPMLETVVGPCMEAIMLYRPSCGANSSVRRQAWRSHARDRLGGRAPLANNDRRFRPGSGAFTEPRPRRSLRTTDENQGSPPTSLTEFRPILGDGIGGGGLSEGLRARSVRAVRAAAAPSTVIWADFARVWSASWWSTGAEGR